MKMSLTSSTRSSLRRARRIKSYLSLKYHSINKFDNISSSLLFYTQNRRFLIGFAGKSNRLLTFVNICLTCGIFINSSECFREVQMSVMKSSSKT